MKKKRWNIFDKEFSKNLDSLKEHGLFLSFSTDPMLKETEHLTWYAIFQMRA